MPSADVVASSSVNTVRPTTCLPVQDSSGRSVELDYNGDLHRASIADATARALRTSGDVRNRLVAAGDPAAASTELSTGVVSTGAMSTGAPVATGGGSASGSSDRGEVTSHPLALKKRATAANTAPSPGGGGGGAARSAGARSSMATSGAGGGSSSSKTRSLRTTISFADEGKTLAPRESGGQNQSGAMPALSELAYVLQ